MAITLANQSASVLGTAANSWAYTLGFTPTVGNKLILYVLTPVSAGSTAGPYAVNHNGNDMACVGTRTGVTGSYNISLFIYNIATTSTTVNMLFTTTSLHGIIAAEFSGWTNISPLATLTSNSAFVSGISSSYPVSGARDFITSGTNQTGIRALAFGTNSSINMSVSTFTETQIDGTPNTSLASAPANYTWFFPATSNISGTGTSVSWSTRNWTTGPSGGNQIALAGTTGSTLTGLTVASGASWTQLTNPSGVSNSILRCYYKVGTNLQNISNTITSSTSTNVTALGQIFGEKSLVTRTVSTSDTVGAGDYLTTTDTIASSYANVGGNGVYTGSVAAGATSFYATNATTGLDPTLEKATYVQFTNGTSVYLRILSITKTGTQDGYSITVGAPVPTIGGQSTWTSASFVALPTTQFTTFPSASESISLANDSYVTRVGSASEALVFNNKLGSWEFCANPYSVIIDYQQLYDDTIPPLNDPTGFPVAGDLIFYVNSTNTDWTSPGNQIIFVDEGSNSFAGPFTIAGGGPNTATSQYFTLQDDLTAGTTSSVFSNGFLLQNGKTIQDFFNITSVYPVVLGVPDPTDDTVTQFLGGFGG